MKFNIYIYIYIYIYNLSIYLNDNAFKSIIYIYIYIFKSITYLNTCKKFIKSNFIPPNFEGNKNLRF